MIAFACPHCGKNNSVGDEWAGQRGQCPWCNQAIDVPAAVAPSATPIVFPCPYCRHKLSVPGAWAGKTGKCPACSQTLQIPRSSEDSFTGPAPPAPASSPPVPVPEPAAAAAEIVFECGHCRRTLSVPGEWAGKSGQCPSCGQGIQIPAASAPPAPAAPAPGSPIIFACEHCGRRVSVGSEWAGMRGQCPGCKGDILIPMTSTASPKDTYGLADEGEGGQGPLPKQRYSLPEEADPHSPRRRKPLYGPGADPPSYRHRTDGGTGDGSNNTAIGWLIFFLVFVVGNIILYSTTGWIIIPRR
jgi:hypothetical protein